MTIYINIALLWAIIVFIVDLSGFTQTWLGWLSKFTAMYNLPAVTELKPFSCSLCMTFWTGTLYAFFVGQLTIPIVAYVCALSFFSITLRELFIFINETATSAVARLNRWLND